MTASAPLDLPAHLFTHVDHVGIAVPDLDAAKALYEQTFGMTVVHEETNEEQGVREAMVAVGDSGSCIQLLAPHRRDLDDREVHRPVRPRPPQLAYRVVDVDQVCAILAARGVRLLYDAPRRGTAGSRINFIHPKDAGGVLVEWSSRPPRALEAHRRPPARHRPSLRFTSFGPLVSPDHEDPP